ncbi:MAG TPA: VWA domain-containing protein [Burkholderiaceae bacterium]|nr:VWA domain-containing protein [Burkholderiaceae bacterium]
MSRLAENVMHFARVLRDAGLPVGTDRVLLSLDALCAAGIRSRADLRSVLAACLLSRGEQQPMFDQAFDLYWRDPDPEGRMMRMLLPQVGQRAAPDLPSNRRLAAALFGTAAAPRGESAERVEFDAALSWSERERLQKADFDTMSAEEWAAAQRLIEQLPALIALRATRRTIASHRGQRLDLRAMLRNAAREGGEFAVPVWQRRAERCEPLVVLVDSSGSMSRYSRMFLHFVHTLIGGRAAADHRVHAFVFATRLTHVTRQLAARDPDHAINAVTRTVQDWSSGTRIAQSLHEFNLVWARRVLTNSPTVLLITDGLEQGGTELLETEAARLARSCRRLVWLNPLLRYSGFEPRAAGVRTLLPHVSAHLPVHSLESLEELIALLARSRALH